MEPYLKISYLNDFIFCPRSIYFHQCHGGRSTRSFQNTSQVGGRLAHQTIDEQSYSSKKDILQGVEVYCDKYKIAGKIDIFDKAKGELRERKKKIVQIYDGFIFQTYAQYFALEEMGYTVQKISLYSLDDNRSYPIALPHQDKEKLKAFEKLLENIHNFSLESFFEPNPNKCERCIYSSLCDTSLNQNEEEY